MSKYVYPQTKRENEKFMDEGGNGRTHVISVNKGGLELRDYFAAMAMQGLCVNVQDPYENNIARMSYSMADAMLKAREVENGDN